MSSRLVFSLIFFLLFLSNPITSRTYKDDLNEGLTNPDGNAPTRILQSPVQVKSPNLQSNLPAGSTVGISNGQIQSDRLISAQNNKGGMLRDSTNVEMNSEGSMRAQFTTQAETKNGQLQNGQNVEVASDGLSMSSDQAENIESTTSSGQTAAQGVKDFNQEYDTTSIGIADHLTSHIQRGQAESRVEGISAQPSAGKPETTQPPYQTKPIVLTAQGITGYQQNSQGTTIQHVKEMAVSQTQVKESAIQQVKAGNPTNQLLLLIENGNEIRFDLDGKASGTFAQNLRLYLPEHTPQGSPRGTISPVLSGVNIKKFQIMIPGLSKAPPLHKRQLITFSTITFLETLSKLSNSDFMIESADSLRYNGVEHKNPRQVKSDVEGNIYAIGYADELTIGHLILKSVKDASIMVNSKTSIFLKKGVEQQAILDGIPLLYNVTNEDNLLEFESHQKLAVSNQKRTITIAGGTLAMPHNTEKLKEELERKNKKATRNSTGNSSKTPTTLSGLTKKQLQELLQTITQAHVLDIITSGNQTETKTLITTHPKTGFECATITPIGAYTYKAPIPENIFSIAILNYPHNVCLRKAQEQSFPNCPECTTIDFIDNTISSQGTAVYRRFHYQKGPQGQIALLSLIPEGRIMPAGTPSPFSYELVTDRNLENITSLSMGKESHKVVPTNALTITDRLHPDGLHRYYSLDPSLDAHTTSNLLIHRLFTSGFPLAYTKPQEWIQTSTDNTAHMKFLLPGHNHIQSLITSRQELISDTSHDRQPWAVIEFAILGKPEPGRWWVPLSSS